jgi:hypothetical protein
MSKSMMLIEAFRAERLRQRQALRGRTGDATPEIPAGPEASGPAACDTLAAPAPIRPPAALLSAVLPGDATGAAAEPGATLPEAGAARPGPAHELALAEIGIGPGMLMRLGQLGLHGIGDLAAIDPATLRTGLGEISRLLDVESWIEAARQKLALSSAP